MKAGILLTVVLIFSFAAFCQQDSSLLRKEIDNRISVMEHFLIPDSTIITDSSRFNRFAYADTYFRNANNNQLGKVEKYFSKMDVRITFVFENNELIRCKIINNSDNVLRIAVLYFRDGALIYSSPNTIDDGRSGESCLAKAKEYLGIFTLISKR